MHSRHYGNRHFGTVDIMGVDILGIDIMGVDILGIDIPAPTNLDSISSYFQIIKLGFIRLYIVYLHVLC